MSAQSHNDCSPQARAKQNKLLMFFAALSIALSVVFGYSMASMMHQDSLVKIAEVHAETIKNLDARHSRVLNKQLKNIREDLRQCLTQKKL